ncbi:glycohydrolase toxin TNT-related protein [Chryseobacterium camelliae]|uniref:glycohydrolase toxin TNT-related protein n=1 Tax=Chryseobacterium camelliae TaxID=1265445 RepID=UPI002859B561|nr:glycohydrolase toxin TNT-related protein [Chryseobacterium camelliae]MDR6514454.1 hypothetical protein [Chryseobacterium camelliae]
MGFITNMITGVYVCMVPAYSSLVYSSFSVLQRNFSVMKSMNGRRNFSTFQRNITTNLPFFRNADELALTYDNSGKVSPLVKQQIFELYIQNRWIEVEAIFIANNLNNSWPPANGGYNVEDDVPLLKGEVYDRYGQAIRNYNGVGVPILAGNFTSPVINRCMSYSERALKLPEKLYDFYYTIHILQTLPFKGQRSSVIPWFSQAGNGVQMMWKIPIDPDTGYQKTWNKLVEEGYIKLTIVSSPSGNYNYLAGMVIQK